MRVRTLLLCKDASVHDGLLFVLDGGVNRVTTEGFPTLLDITLAVAFELENSEREPVSHDMRFLLLSPGRKRVGEGQAHFSSSSTIETADLPSVVPIAAPIRGVVTGPGRYSVVVWVDGRRLGSLPLLLVGPEG